ncbi:MAG: T9SS type A sorting domain-containing protein [Ignavibacteria bacterium]|nr:T9SS type A sorting domain-containing protein [Ignavibacteria bacterium]
MSQNYPNPFNPNTVIRYSITGNRNVNLKVFDALGKEIVTLVNEKQNTGSYLVDFYGEGLPSGVYFYRLQAGEFVETKSMILLK